MWHGTRCVQVCMQRAQSVRSHCGPCSPSCNSPVVCMCMCAEGGPGQHDSVASVYAMGPALHRVSGLCKHYTLSLLRPLPILPLECTGLEEERWWAVWRARPTPQAPGPHREFVIKVLRETSHELALVKELGGCQCEQVRAGLTSATQAPLPAATV